NHCRWLLLPPLLLLLFFFFSSRRRHTRFSRDWSSDVCSSDLWSTRTLSQPSSIASFSVALLSASRVACFFCSRRPFGVASVVMRSEERRVGKECRAGWSRRHYKGNYGVDKTEVSIRKISECAV